MRPRRCPLTRFGCLVVLGLVLIAALLSVAVLSEVAVLLESRSQLVDEGGGDE